MDDTPWMGDRVILVFGDELLLMSPSGKFSSSSLIDGNAGKCPLFSDSVWWE